MLQIYIPKANGLKLLNVHSWSRPGLSSQDASFTYTLPLYLLRHFHSFESLWPLFFTNFLHLSLYLHLSRATSVQLCLSFCHSVIDGQFFIESFFPLSFFVSTISEKEEKTVKASTTHFDLPTCSSSVLIFFPSYSQEILFATPRESRTSIDIASANKLHRKTKLSLTRDEFRLIRSPRIGRFFFRLRQPILGKCQDFRSATTFHSSEKEKTGYSF